MSKPRNLRMIHPEACATCHRLKFDGDGWRCRLPDGPRYVDVQPAYWYRCDLWMVRVLVEDKEEANYEKNDM